MSKSKESLTDRRIDQPGRAAFALAMAGLLNAELDDQDRDDLWDDIASGRIDGETEDHRRDSFEARRHFRMEVE